ncbi:MAG: DUF6265 family protein [Acidobacteriota bacterium]
MKITLWLALSLIARLAGGATTDRLQDLAWMSGSWASGSSEEIWMQPKAGMMLGMGRTVTPKGAQFEFMRITVSASGLVYLASPEGHTPTPFPLRELAGKRAVFENRDHDFPQRIIYWRKGDALCGRIEGTIRGKAESEQWCWNRAD